MAWKRVFAHTHISDCSEMCCAAIPCKCLPVIIASIDVTRNTRIGHCTRVSRNRKLLHSLYGETSQIDYSNFHVNFNKMSMCRQEELFDVQTNICRDCCVNLHIFCDFQFVKIKNVFFSSHCHVRVSLSLM